jgi:hypothetical protein
LKVLEFTNLLHQRLVAEFPDLVVSEADEYENYNFTLPGKDLDLFAMGCDDCFATVWFNGHPVCDYSDAGPEDADDAATYVASALRERGVQ